ncbi:mucin-5AC-like [Culex pipiens pallens]|uniref:mucin-5AC-like n=1 Tax=Culex pipiens pallens TaxID=42434 RepID=UPI001953C783|nr:mucin-5AC-like [Culex pipiens pallens]
MWSSVILLTVSALLTSAQNDFDVIQGCKQYTISRPSYNSPNPYYALDQFQDLQQVEVAGLKIRSIKIAVIGSNDGVIRLSPVEQPYQNTLMDEIVLSGWGNTRNAVRQYVRSSPSRYTRAVILANQLSGGILSPYKPFVFTLSIVNDHLVALSKNGESLPFLQYTDVGVTPKYIGFSNWNAPVSVFYDCPPPALPATTTAVPDTTTSVAPVTTTVGPATTTVDPVTTTTVDPVTTTTVDPVTTTIADPVTTTTVDPVTTTTVDPVTTTAVDPGTTTTLDPVTTTTVDPGTTTTVDPGTTTTVDPETTTTVDPGTTTTVDPGTTTTVDPETTTTVDPADPGDG